RCVASIPGGVTRYRRAAYAFRSGPCSNGQSPLGDVVGSGAGEGRIDRRATPEGRRVGECDGATRRARTLTSATVACPFCETLNRVDMTRIGQHPKCGNCGKPILLDR